jgi:O-antigen/teichoic acid export membrane protein
LGGAFVFICFGYLNGNILAVMGLQKRLLLISLIALVVNVVGNLILVPAVGFMGAAWMTLATEIVVFGASLSLILRALDMKVPRAGRFGRTALAATVLWGVLTLIDRAGASLAILVLTFAICYPALLFGLRAISVADLRVLLKRGATV